MQYKQGDMALLKSVVVRLSWPVASRIRVVLSVLAALFLSGVSALAQWQTQAITLKAGWNAVYLHVDASYAWLDDLIPAADDPVAEIWLWHPTLNAMQFVTDPETPVPSGSRWSSWTAQRGDADTLGRLVGNAAYLVRCTTDVVWRVKGRPLPPSYQWTATGLNLLGFPTPAGSAPMFDRFLAPAPGLDPLASLVNGVEIIRYPGGPLAPSNVNPRLVSPLESRTTPVNRGEAFWIRAASNYYNRYYGPIEVAPQNPRGILFDDDLSAYSVRLKNLTATNRTVTFSMIASESVPAGQSAIVGLPGLLVRGARSMTNFSYSYTVLNNNSFTLTPMGQEGSELDVVLGLNRSAMTAAAGSLYAGVLRIVDSEGLSQVDLPVSATVPSLGGLWVGEAEIDQVGQYLKTYPKLTGTVTAPRSSFLRLPNTTNSGSNASAQLPAGIYFRDVGFTVEAWVSIRRHAEGQRLIDFGNGSNDNNVVFGLSQGVAGQPFAQVYRGAAGGAMLASAESLPLNQWVHLALTQDAPVGGATTAATRLYVNGILKVQGVINVPVGTVRNGAYIGKSNGSAPLADVDVDDVRIWSTSRTENQIRLDAAVGSYPAATAGLVAQYDFSKSANPGLDSGSAGAHLVLAGGAVRVAVDLGADEAYAGALNESLVLAGRPLAGTELPGATWVSRKPVLSLPFTSLASSDDGRVLIAADNGTTGRIRLSFDWGANWVAVGPAGVFQWAAVACSGNGTVLAAAAFNGSVYVSQDAGSNWVARGVSAQWQSIAVSDNGNAMLGVVLGGYLYTTSDGGRSWTQRGSLRNWVSCACSGDGTRMVAAVGSGNIYVSLDSGVTWTMRGPSTSWKSVVCSVDGSRLAASALDGAVYTSSDCGTNWVAHAVPGGANKLSGLAMSSDGKRLVVAANGTNLFCSTDYGVSWYPQGSVGTWVAVASSADGTRLAAVMNVGGIYTRVREFAEYTQDPDSGLIRAYDGSYISTGVNTNMAATASTFPLRLILHSDAGVGTMRLLQRVWVGRGAYTSNIVVASREDLLDASQIASARRISAAHLPYTDNNTFWSTSGRPVAGAVVRFNVPLDFDDQGSNPFLHTFHPDHDNLDVDFAKTLALGVESYGINREITLTFDRTGSDFAALTANSLALHGTYQETVTLTGKSGASRRFQLAGSFTIRRISAISTLTTN